jgi:hypothetical protein
MGSRELMVTPRQNSLILLNIDTATSQELPETHIEPRENIASAKVVFHPGIAYGIPGSHPSWTDACNMFFKALWAIVPLTAAFRLAAAANP